MATELGNDFLGFQKKKCTLALLSEIDAKVNGDRFRRTFTKNIRNHRYLSMMTGCLVRDPLPLRQGKGWQPAIDVVKANKAGLQRNIKYMTYEIKANAVMYYGMDSEHPNDIVIETTLNEDIDSEVMETAINAALRRYPYFAVRLKEQQDRLVLEENMSRVRLHDRLASGNDDGFLFCFTAEGATLKVLLAHALTDVHGFMPFVKTILAEYYNRQNGRSDIYNGINLADSEVTDAELVEPLSLLPDNTKAGKPSETAAPAFRLPEAGTDDQEACHYCLSLDNNVVKEFVKSMGGSFTSTVSALFAKAIAGVHDVPGDADIVCTNIIDRKPLLGCPSSHYLSMHPASYAIDGKLMAGPLNDLVAAIRNDLHRKMKTDIFSLGWQMKQFIDYLVSVPSTRARQQICRQVVNSRRSNSTFSVSYVGVVDFGSLNDKVRHIHIQALASPVLIEACAHGDVFDITLIQSMKTDAYFRAFTKVLEDYGLWRVRGRVPDPPRLMPG